MELTYALDRNQRSIEVPILRVSWGLWLMDFSAWGDFDPPDAAEWLRLNPERNALAAASRLEQPLVVVSSSAL